MSELEFEVELEPKSEQLDVLIQLAKADMSGCWTMMIGASTTAQAPRRFWPVAFQNRASKKFLVINLVYLLVHLP